jgi:hypothetical protein
MQWHIAGIPEFILSALFYYLCSMQFRAQNNYNVHVVAVKGSQGVSIQVLVLHGDMLGWRISDSNSWNNIKKGQECMEARMGS